MTTAVISQSEQILDYLKNGGKLTPIDALKKFGCFRLGARIYDLKQRGYNIHAEIITTDKGKHVAQYSMKQFSERLF